MEKERAKKYEVSITLKSNGYYIATISLKIGGEPAKRIENSGTTEELALLGLLNKIMTHIDTAFNNGLITCKFDDRVSQRLVDSVNKTGISTPEILQKILIIVNKINNINAHILQNISLQTNIWPFHQSLDIANNTTTINNNLSSNYEKPKSTIENKVMLENFAIEWIKYRFSLCNKTEDNPKPLSKKTIDGYYKKIIDIILPYCKKNKKLYLHELTENFIIELLKIVKGQTSKRQVYIILNMLFKYAIKNKKITENPLTNIDKPVQISKPEIEKLNDYIEPDRQDIWLDYFEKENTDMSLLFETMLLTGIRPEEACGLKWSAMDLDNNELIINNAYKEFIVYDDDMKPIGHTRHDDKLKTIESNRRIPLNPRLMEVLLKHKQEQKELFKNSQAIKRHNRKWTSNEYMFLSRTYQPYVSDTLSSGLPKFCRKYNLEKMTPYGLRHSFATFCSEQGMEQIVLMRLMGHTDFQTTQKYYIRVSPKRKKLAMQKAYKDTFFERKVV